jgi:hypothetical protein
MSGYPVKMEVRVTLSDGTVYEYEVDNLHHQASDEPASAAHPEVAARTEAECTVRAWLERQADHYMEHGEFTSDMPLGVTGFGVRADLDAGSVREGPVFSLSPIRDLTFYACWRGVELTTTRRRWTKRPVSR